MTKRTKAVGLTGIEKAISDLQVHINMRRFEGKSLEAALSLQRQYLTRDSLTYKQVEFLKSLNKSAIRVKKQVEASKKHCLYAITDGENVKLGVSSDLKGRIKDLQTSNAKQLKVVWKYYTGKDKKHAFTCERKLHRVCSKYRLKGEWFDLECMSLVNKFKVK